MDQSFDFMLDKLSILDYQQTALEKYMLTHEFDANVKLESGVRVFDKFLERFVHNNHSYHDNILRIFLKKKELIITNENCILLKSFFHKLHILARCELTISDVYVFFLNNDVATAILSFYHMNRHKLEIGKYPEYDRFLELLNNESIFSSIMFNLTIIKKDLSKLFGHISGY